MGHVKSAQFWCAAGLVSLAAAVAGCSGVSAGSGFGGDAGLGAPDGAFNPTPHKDATVSGDSGHPKKLVQKDAGQCVPSTCTELNANCGFATDKKCGTVVQCGTCGAGLSCGAGGVPNQCAPNTITNDGAMPGDGCVLQTCASQSINCGAASNGCGGMLSCGTCNLPQTCGGDPTKPGQCGCTGLCSQVATCPGSGTTDLIGTVYDPKGVNPLYNVLVYVPNNPSDPGLQPFPAGISCDLCGATAAGDPLVTTYTAADGTFTLKGVPVGMNIPVIIQLGRWRRQFSVNITNSCGANSAGMTLSMPSSHTQGDMPRIAVLTGGCDPVECALLDFGIDQSEFTDPGAGGYINFFSGAAGAGSPGAVLPNSSDPGQDALFATTGAGDGGTQPFINNYDITILECQCNAETETPQQEAQLAAYLAAGGRVFGSDYIYDWFYDNPALSGAATWNGDHSGDGVLGPVAAVIDPVSENPTATAFQDWLEIVGVPGAASGTVSISPGPGGEYTPIFPNVPSVIPPTQEWLYTNSAEDSSNPAVPPPIPVHFTFNAPLGAPAAQQCGRVTFSDWHAFGGVFGEGTTFPSACESGGAGTSPQEKILEFMLFDLSACVQPYTPICTPQKCAAQNIECGPAGDGCGNLIQCGGCDGGTCGGGGNGKCGTMTTTTSCMPETCASQGIQCGPAGDGCGNELQCGGCKTGQFCGYSSPGVCGGSGGA